MLLQEKFKYKYRTMSAKKRLFATEKLTFLSLAFCGVVQGFSVVTGFGFSTCLSFSLGIAYAIKSFPECSVIFLMHKTGGGSFFHRVSICFLLTILFFSGMVIGLFLGNTSDITPLRFLVFSGGITLYTAVGDMSIESKLLYSGRFLPIFNLGGMICGTILILTN